MYYSTGVFAGIIAALIILILIRKNSGEQHYDEMQLKLRGDGYKLGFLTTVICAVAYAFYSDLTGSTVLSTGFALLLVTFIGIAVFSVFCIVKEAFFSVGQRGKLYLICCIIVLAGNLLISVDKIKSGELFEDGQITIPSGSNLIIAGLFGMIMIAFIVKLFRKGNIDEES